jgi:GTP-binding protein Era
MTGQNSPTGSKTKCGIIAILGRPNAGKSTLVNALVGQKICAVSAKQQTTRNRIMGIVTVGATQMIFADTPGLHESPKPSHLHDAMNDAAWAGLKGSDVCAYLVDLEMGFQVEDGRYLNRLINGGAPLIWVIGSKADSIPGDRRKLAVEQLKAATRDVLLNSVPPSGRVPQVIHWTMSAKVPTQVNELKELWASELPDGPWLYDPDQLTDRPTQFVIGELIREQAFRLLSEELPYRLTVAVQGVDFNQDIPHIHATIVVGQESHKGMVIGAGGSTIKRIGAAARPAIEELLGERVYLALKVAVDKSWYERPDSIQKYLQP